MTNPDVDSVVAGLSERQPQVTLESALLDAMRIFRAEANAYRNAHGDKAKRMDKRVRQALAATYNERALVLEAHLTAVRARLAAQEGE